MARLLFEKTGNAVWISHLDLMRLFQRAFKRAQLPLTHTQGFNPRPSVSIALPLSVGVESHCELLDFHLDGVTEFTPAQIKERLNAALTDGVRVLDVYTEGRKIRDLALLHCQLDLIFDREVPANATDDIIALFAQDSLLVEKKTKSGLQEQNIIPMIRKLDIFPCEKGIRMEALICCQNPTLNPAQLSQAICKYLPDFTPDATECRRIEIYDVKEQIFR